MSRNRVRAGSGQGPTILKPVLVTDPEAITALRLAILEQGYVPCANRDKTTKRKGWNENPVDEATVRRWLPERTGQTLWPATGLMVEKGLFVLDLDVPIPALAIAMREELYRIAPQLFQGGLERGRDDDSPKTMFIARRLGDPFHLNSGCWVKSLTERKPVHHQVEVFAQERTAEGRVLRQVGAFGPHTVTPEGEIVRSYAWKTATPAEVPLADLPAIDEETGRAICAAFDRLAEAHGLQLMRRGGKITPRNLYDLTDRMVFENESFRGNLAELVELYWAWEGEDDPRISGSFTGEGGERQDRCHVGWSGPREGGHITITDYSTEITHRPLSARPPDLAEIAAVLQRARERLGLGQQHESREEGEEPEPDPEQLMRQAAQSNFSHAATSAALAEMLAGGLRYSYGEACWRLFDGPHWAAEAAGEAQHLIGSLCVAFSRAAATPQKRTSMQSITYLNAIRTRLAIEPQIATPATAWDGGGWLLPTLTEVVDLRTGARRPGRPQDMIRRRAGVDMADEARCPRFQAFLDLITLGDKALQRFLQQWAGQGVVGELLEQRLAFFHGSGSNGKGTFITIQKAVLGDFFEAAPKHLFLERRQKDHDTELLCFDGSRAVFGAEPPLRATWDMSLIKTVTGGDPLKVRGMRQNYWTVQPGCALTIAGNNQPRFETIDNSVIRRFLLVPFLLQMEKAEEESDFAQRLVAAEGPAILRWMVEGLLDWLQTRQLFIASAVAEATAEYFEDEDAIGEFLRTQCVVEAGARIGRKHLFSAWEDYARQQKRPTGSPKALSAKVQKLEGVTDGEGYAVRGERFWFGLRLKTVKDFSREHLRPVE